MAASHGHECARAVSRPLLVAAALLADAMYSQAPRSGRAAVEAPVMRSLILRASIRSLRLFWLSSGRQDFLYQANGQFAESLEAKGVKVMVRTRRNASTFGACGATI